MPHGYGIFLILMGKYIFRHYFSLTFTRRISHNGGILLKTAKDARIFCFLSTIILNLIQNPLHFRRLRVKPAMTRGKSGTPKTTFPANLRPAGTSFQKEAKNHCLTTFTVINIVNSALQACCHKTTRESPLLKGDVRR